MAIQCGQPVESFWYDPLDYFNAYVQAYYRRISFEAWLAGKYVYDAATAAVANAGVYAIGRALDGKHVKHQDIRYPSAPIDLLKATEEKKEEKELTREEIYRQALLKLY